MYSTVSVRIGISWCVQYCVSKDRDLLVYSTVSVRIGSTVSVRIGISGCVQYCVSKDRDLLVYSTVSVSIGIYSSTVSTAFLLFQNAELLHSHSARCMHPSDATCMTTRWRRLNVLCAVPTTNVPRLLLHVPHGHGTGQGKDSVKTVTCRYIMTLKA